MRLAIVGGGLAGLTIARRSVDAGVEVVLFERETRLGGQLSTVHEDGFVVELGAEGFVARSEAVPKLAHDVGATGLIDQRATTSFRFAGGVLRAFAPGEAAEALRFQVSASDKGAGLRTFAGGMQSLTDALASGIEGRIDRRARPAGRVERIAGGVEVDGEPFDAVVVATSAAAAAALTNVDALAEGEALSSVTVSLAYRADQVKHALDGTGFVVAEPFEGFRACTFVSSKFAHRAPDGRVQLRAFFRPTDAELAAPTPWAERAARVIGRVLVVEGAPERSWVSIWPRALPVFDDARRATLAAVDAELAAAQIHLSGSAFHGSGIDAAVRSAERVAARLLRER